MPVDSLRPKLVRRPQSRKIALVLVGSRFYAYQSWHDGRCLLAATWSGCRWERWCVWLCRWASTATQEHIPHLSVLQAEIRRRLWATIVELSLQACLDSGMPPMISSDNFNIKPPANVNDADINASSTHLVSQPADRSTDTSIQLLLLNCLPARLKAAKSFNGLSQEMEYGTVMALGTEIKDACHRSKNLMTESGRHVMFHQNLVSYFLLRFILPLHRPFLTMARSNPLYSFSRKVSLDTSVAILYPEVDEDFSHFRLVSGGTVKHTIH